MDVLGHRGSPGRYLMVPDDAERIVGEPRHAAIVDRRRRTFTILVGASSLLLFGALLQGGALWVLFVLSLAALGAYVLLLLRYKAQRLQAEWVVQALPTRDVSSQRAPLERVVGGEVPSNLQVVSDPMAPWEPTSGVRIRRWED